MRRFGLFLMLLAVGCTGDSPDTLQTAASPVQIMVIAHRGAAGRAPENTLPAIREALRLDADAIEVDLRQSADGTVVAIHDATVDRTTDGSGKVGAMTHKALRTLDAGGWFAPRFAGARIPTLEEILEAVPERTTLILEVKNGDYPGIVGNIAERLRSRQRQNVILKSFATEVLADFERLAPQYPRLYVFNVHLPWLNLIVDDGLRIGNPFDQDVSWLQQHGTFITAGFVRRAQDKGLRVVAWDIHEFDEMCEAIALGVDGIETNWPGRLKELLKNPGACSANR